MASLENNLLDVFRAKGIADEELPGFLNSHFGSSGHRSETNEVFYPNQASPVLVLVYKKGRLLEVRAGVGFDDEGLDELCDVIYCQYIGTTEIGFRQEVLLSNTKVQGTWRYRDRLQLMPIPATAPHPPFSYAEHPLLIEHSYVKTSNGLTSAARGVRELRRLELLLGCLLVSSIRSNRFSGSGRTHQWIIKHGGESSYEQLGYHWKLQILETLSSMTDVNPIMLVGASEYYVGAFQGSQIMVLPDDLSESMDSFFGLEHDDQQRFLQACFWCHQADRSPSFSVSFINLVQAIETLLPAAETKGRCTQCSTEIKQGPTALFKEFMDNFAPMSAGGSDIRQDLYRTRSRLVHGQAGPFLDDMNPQGNLNPLAVQEMEFLNSARQAVRIAMRNWLRPRKAVLQDKPTTSQHHFSISASTGQRVTVSSDGIRTLQNGVTENAEIVFQPDPPNINNGESEPSI